MNLRGKIISLALSIIGTLIIMFVVSRYMQLHGLIFVDTLVIFVMLFIIFTSIYDIIKKNNQILCVWLILEGINGIILILSFSSIAAKNSGILEKAMPYPIAMTSLILFFIISGVCMKIEQNMKEKQEEESK